MQRQTDTNLQRPTLVERFNWKTANATRITNTSHKLPIVLLLDTSGSMNYDPGQLGVRNIDRLNEGVNHFYEHFVNDDLASKYAEIAIVTFGQGGVQVVQQFSNPKEQLLPIFEAEGISPLCSGIVTALDILEDQIELYNSHGIKSHPPVLIGLTDGEPTTLDFDETGDPIMLDKNMKEFKVTHDKFKKFKQNLNLDAHMIYFGDDVKSTYFLNQFASKPQHVKKLKDLNIVKFFNDLGKSTSLLSKLSPTGDSKLMMDENLFEIV